MNEWKKYIKISKKVNKPKPERIFIEAVKGGKKGENSAINNQLVDLHKNKKKICIITI